MRFGRKIAAIVPVITIATIVMLQPVLASVVVNEIQVPLSGTVFNPCNGELVAFQGSGHVLSKVTFNGNTGHLSFHFNTQGLHAVGLTTGATYVGSEADNQELNFNSSGTFETTVTSTFTEIGNGKVPNFIVHTVFHVTITPAGTVTAIVDQVSAVCH